MGSPDIAAIAQSLSASPVHVDPAVPGARDLIVKYENTLAQGDYIMLVALPEGDMTADQVAEAISAAVGADYIVGVAVGDEVAAAGPRMPAGRPHELMGKADTITNSATETLVTYTYLVHDWQATEEGKVAMTPKTTTTTSTTPPPPADGFPVVPVAGGALLAVVVVAAVVWRFLTGRRPQYGNVKVDPNRPATSTELRAAILSWPNVGLPRSAQEHLDQVLVDTSDILSRWDRVAQRPEISAEVQQIALNYVPTMLNLYAELPADLRQKATRSGKSPAEGITAQLRLIDDRLDEIREAAYRDTMDELEVQTLFLDQKYRVSELDMARRDD